MPKQILYIVIIVLTLMLTVLLHNYYMAKSNDAGLALGLIYGPKQAVRSVQKYQDLHVEMSPQLSASMLSQTNNGTLFKPVLNGVDISRPNYMIGATVNFAEDAEVGSAGEYGGISA